MKRDEERIAVGTTMETFRRERWGRLATDDHPFCVWLIPDVLPHVIGDEMRALELIESVLAHCLEVGRREYPVIATAAVYDAVVDLRFQCTPRRGAVIPLRADTVAGADLLRVRLWQESFNGSGVVLHCSFLRRLALPRRTDTPPNVLVVDDSEEIRTLIELYLKREGFTVHTAKDGREGLALARELRPDLITLDIMMPEMDGWQVLQQLKPDPRTADIPVVIIETLKEYSAGYRLGAVDYLTKPVTREELKRSVARLL